MAKPGRKPTPEDEKQRIIAHILEELATGRPVSRTCREDEGICDAKTFWRWYFNDEALRQKVADARASGIEAKMDEAMDVAESPMVGEIVTVEGEKRTVKTEDMLGHRRLVVDTIHKQAQMLKPKTYGPKLDLTSDGKALGISDAMRAAEKRVSDQG